MAQAKAEHEPTMEEILASIRRIISEDEPAAGAAASVAAGVETVEEPDTAIDLEPEPLELTQRIEDVEDDGDLVIFDEAEPEPAPPPPPPPAPKPKPEPVRAVAPAPAPVQEDPMPTHEEDLVSEPVANAAASAFGQLVGQMVMTRGTENKTIEDLVREMLKPMIKDWLDANLRQIVEAKVQQEVQRIANRARH